MKQEIQNNQPPDFFSQLSSPDSGVWELIFDSIPDMVALIDLDNIVVKANKAMRQKIKVGEKSLTGYSCNSLMHHDGCANANCPHLRMMRDRKPHSVELFEPKFGLYLEISTVPIFDANNNLLGSLHISRDISIRKESEAKLNKYNEELKELNQSKDKFFSIVAHDLRSPFQGMLGFTDLILDQIEFLSKNEIRDYLQKVRDSSYSTFTLLENLLNWSRIQTGRMQYLPSEFSLSESVAGIFSLLDSNAQSKHISLINNLTSDFTIYADRQMVHSILLNLTTNAIKFTYPGGTVSIDAKINEDGENIVTANPELNYKSLIVSVTDTGTGMSADIIEKILAMDNHMSNAGTANEQGAGLGLILVKEMVEKHGGNLSIKSQESEGSTFSFSVLMIDE